MLVQEDIGIAKVFCDISERELMRDVVKSTSDSMSFKNELSLNTNGGSSIEHRAFTAQGVDAPEVGQKYR